MVEREERGEVVVVRFKVSTWKRYGWVYILERLGYEK